MYVFTPLPGGPPQGEDVGAEAAHPAAVGPQHTGGLGEWLAGKHTVAVNRLASVNH